MFVDGLHPESMDLMATRIGLLGGKPLNWFVSPTTPKKESTGGGVQGRRQPKSRLQKQDIDLPNSGKRRRPRSRGTGNSRFYVRCEGCVGTQQCVDSHKKNTGNEPGSVQEKESRHRDYNGPRKRGQPTEGTSRETIFILLEEAHPRALRRRSSN